MQQIHFPFVKTLSEFQSSTVSQSKQSWSETERKGLNSCLPIFLKRPYAVKSCGKEIKENYI